MAKPGLKDVLLKKGEKVALIAGAAVAGLLLVMGVQTMASVSSPDETVKHLKDNATRIKSGLQAAGEPAPPLPEWAVAAPKETVKVKATDLPLRGNVFEPVSTPDLLRHNPRVLGVMDSQIDYVQGPMKALDIRENEGAPPSIGVLVTATKADVKSAADLGNIVVSVLRNRDAAAAAKAKKKQPQRKGPVFPGAMVPGAVAPPTPAAPGGAPPVFGQAPPGMTPGGMPMGSDAGGYNSYGDTTAMYDPAMAGQRAGIDKTVRYLTPDEARKSGYPLAETVYPLRMVVAQMAYPLKEQIEEIRQALRIPDPARAGYAAGMPPGSTPGYPMTDRGAPPGYPAPMGSGPPGYPMPTATTAAPPGYPMPGAQGSTMPGSPGTMMPAANVQPYFYGFEVERLAIPPGAPLPKPGDPWAGAPFDHEDEYFRTIRARKVADQPDAPELYPFLRYDQRLAAPLPVLADQLAEYPRTTLKPIVDTVAKIKERMTPKEIEDDWKKRFKNSAGGDNPYAPVAQGAYTAGAGAMGSTDTATLPPGSPMPGSVPPGYPMPGAPGSVPYTADTLPPGYDPVTAGTPMPEIEHLLLRFVDPTVQPGYRYQYRVRVVMHNPNWVKGAEDERVRTQQGLDKVLRRPTDAAVQRLYGPWVPLHQTIAIPSESFLYAFDGQTYLDRAEKLVETYGGESALKRLTEEREVKAGQKAVIQFQTWMPQVRIDGSGKTEPVGSWVVSEVPVGRGEYIGKRQLVELPLWSAALKNYVLRELTGGVKVAGIKDQNNQPKGWPINFKTSSVLVDFDGGLVRATLRGRDLEDAADTEVLVLRPDGKMLVRSSARDTGNEARTARDTGWTEWIARVKQRKDVGTMGPMGSNPNDFGRQPMGSPGSP